MVFWYVGDTLDFGPSRVGQITFIVSDTNHCYLCMKRAIAPPQRANTMSKMIISSGLTKVPLVEMVTVQLEGREVTARKTVL